MATEISILDAFSQLTREKSLDRAEVIELVKAGMLAAVRRKYGPEANADILVDPATGEINIYRLMEIVPDEESVEDPSRQMTAAEAKELPYDEPWGEGDPEPGQYAEIPLDFRTFGRNAIQAAKQMIIQKVREEERERIRQEYADRVGELVSGTVQQVDRGNALVVLDRRTEALLPAREQVRREYLRQGETVRALLLDIRESTKGPQLILSRTHPDFVRALFALEVPEVFQGIVEIRAIAREPGSRSKIAVWSRDSHVDPVGACVGLKGSRVQAVVSELGGERIDIVPWSDDTRQFIAQSLSPAEVYKIILHEPEGDDEGDDLFGERFRTFRAQRFRGPTAAPAPFQPASPEETAAALEASKVARQERAARDEEAREVLAEEAREVQGEEPVAAPPAEPTGAAAKAEATASERPAPERPAPPAERERRATVVCAEDQLSLAIGRSGQNVRLASKLTGYRIDLVSKQDYLAKEEEILFGRRSAPEPAAGALAAQESEDFALAELPGISPETVQALTTAGYRTFEDVIDLEHEDLEAIEGVDEGAAGLIMKFIDELTVEVDEEWDEETGEFVESAPGEEDDETGGEEEDDEAGEEDEAGGEVEDDEAGVEEGALAAAEDAEDVGEPGAEDGEAPGEAAAEERTADAEPEADESDAEPEEKRDES
ncbi:MAG TPA: transcription termination factor NusA [Gemmatimonadota bacterium]|nr:transcription termination factor NusA [Gemmatimonadota bacterium]